MEKEQDDGVWHTVEKKQSSKKQNKLERKANQLGQFNEIQGNKSK